MEIPPYFRTRQVAKACGWKTRYTRDYLQQVGILERDGQGHYRVGESALRERLPDIYQRVLAHYEFGQ
jgi:hypothetical protein